MGRSGDINTSLASSVRRASTYTTHQIQPINGRKVLKQRCGGTSLFPNFTPGPDWSDYRLGHSLALVSAEIVHLCLVRMICSWWLRLRCRNWVSWRSKMFHRIYGIQLEFRHTPIKALNTDFYLSKRFLLSFYYIPNLQFNISWKVYCLYCR